MTARRVLLILALIAAFLVPQGAADDNCIGTVHGKYTSTQMLFSVPFSAEICGSLGLGSSVNLTLDLGAVISAWQSCSCDPCCGPPEEEQVAQLSIWVPITARFDIEVETLGEDGEITTEIQRIERTTQFEVPSRPETRIDSGEQDVCGLRVPPGDGRLIVDGQMSASLNLSLPSISGLPGVSLTSTNVDMMFSNICACRAPGETRCGDEYHSAPWVNMPDFIHIDAASDSTQVVVTMFHSLGIEYLPAPPRTRDFTSFVMTPISADADSASNTVEVTYDIALTEGQQSGFSSYETDFVFRDVCGGRAINLFRLEVYNFPPSIVIENEGWDDDASSGAVYKVKFAVHDLDLDRCLRQQPHRIHPLVPKTYPADNEHISLEILNAEGGIAYWENSGVNFPSCREPYAVPRVICFEPEAGYSDPRRFTIVARDQYGNVAVEVVDIPNQPPIAVLDGSTANVGGGGIAGSGGFTTVATRTIPYYSDEAYIHIFEHNWKEVGCVTFIDPDGDDLTIRVTNVGGTPARVDPLIISGKPGVYPVKLMYYVDRERALSEHRGDSTYVDLFAVTATDPFGAWARVLVEVTVDMLNSDPVCVDDEVTTPMNTTVEFEVLGNDSDIDGDELTVIAVGAAGNGMASSVSDNTIRYVPNNGFYGDDTFTYTAEDGYEGVGSATVTVHVVDTEPPVFVKGPGDVGPLSNIAGTCGAVGKWTAPVSDVDVSDNIGLASLTCTHASGDTFPVGVTTVTYTATDLSSNTTDHAFTVTVVDDEQPTIDGMPSDICVEVPIGITETTVSWIGPTARDNCSVSSLVGTHTPGAVFPLGKTSVVYTATDIHGNIVTDSLGVTVAEAWQLACADRHVTTSNPSGTTVSFADPVTSGCGVITMFDPVSGSFFDIGDTDVMCEVTDGMRTETCTFTVTVEFVNHDPVANGDVVDLKDSEIATEIDVLKNDSDADGDDLTIIDVSTSSPCGEAWIDADGKSVWFIGMYCQPYLGGTATFTYTISDGNGGEDTATVRVNLPDTGVMPEVAEPPKDGR